MSFSRFSGQGPSFVPAYQVSGVPFVTSSASAEVTTTVPIKVSFPTVTRWVQVRNNGSNSLRVGFTENGVKGTETTNFYLLSPSTAASGHTQATTDRWEVRCTEVFVMAQGGTTGFSLMAGLTGVKQFPVVTGSNGFRGVG